MIKTIKTWREKRKIKEKEQEWIKRREASMYNLLVDLETEESITLFKELDTLFKNTLQKRLERVTTEKANLEEFLK